MKHQHLKKFNGTQAGVLRNLLEDQLTLVFACNKINKYLVPEHQIDEPEALFCNIEYSLALPQIKSAYNIWTNMPAADRYAVLEKFYNLFAGLELRGSSGRKTIIFCALFIHEFANILGDATEWPE